MRHWYLLAKAYKEGDRISQSQRLIAGKEPTFSESLSRNDLHCMYLLGAVEALPLVASATIGFYIGTGLSFGISVPLGIVGCLITCWLLRHKTPPLVISMKQRVTKERCNDDSLNA